MDHIKNCARYSEQIFSYAQEIVRGEVGEGVKAPEDEKRKELLLHLETCEECRKELSECVELLRETDSGGEEVPSELHGSIMEYVKAEAKVAKRRRITKLLGGAAAAFVLVVGVFAAIEGGGFSVANDADIAPENAYYNGAGNMTPELDYSASGDIPDGNVNGDENQSKPSDEAEMDEVYIGTESIEEAISKEETDGVGSVTGEETRPEAETPTEAEPSEDAEDGTEGSDAVIIVDVKSVMEDLILTTEYDGGVCYSLSGVGAGTVFDGLTDLSETDSYAYGEYFILLFDVSLLDDVDAEIVRLAKENGTDVEFFKFGTSDGCVAVIIKR